MTLSAANMNKPLLTISADEAYKLIEVRTYGMYGSSSYTSGEEENHGGHQI